MKSVPLLLSLLCLLACSSEQTGRTDTAQADTTQTPAPSEGAATSACYTSIMGPDTMRLQVMHSGDDVTGNLSLNFYEKDDNEGTLRGQMHGDTLLADYTFMSEGTESVRQVVFLKKDGDFVEGYGDMEDREGKMVFLSTARVDFGSGTIFKKVPCQ